VLATFFGAAGVPQILSPVPCYTFPESAARALAHASAYAERRATARGVVPRFADLDRGAARVVIDRAIRNGGGWIAPLDCNSVLQACGVRIAPTYVARTAADACACAQQLGLPVVLKGSGPGILHKTEARAVHTGLVGSVAVRNAFYQLAQRTDVAQVLVQPMVRGVEMFVGASVDPKFGHAVLCGSGGTLVELLRDVACRLAPLTDVTAREMLDEVRGVALLRGYRGAPPADVAAFRETLLRVSALLEVCPEIEELDLNPVLVSPEGATVVDARIRVSSGVARSGAS
jgi:acyl-CoA synthetase (NDP forming)